MKLSVGLIASAAAAKNESPSGRKVPPRHPLQRLNRLNDFITEIMGQHGDNFAKIDPTKWTGKFQTTTVRMEIAFRRATKKCGNYNENNVEGHGVAFNGFDNEEADTQNSAHNPEDGLTAEHINYQGGKNRKRRDVGDGLDRYTRDNPCQGIREIMQGYRKWSDRYLGRCDGQASKEHHRRRADKWYRILIGHRGWQCPGPVEDLGYTVGPAPEIQTGNVADGGNKEYTDNSESAAYGVDCSVEDCTPAVHP